MAFTDSFTYSNGNLTANGSWLTPTGGTSSAVDTGQPGLGFYTNVTQTSQFAATDFRAENL